MVPARLLLSLASAVLSEHIPTSHDAFSFDSAPSPANGAGKGTTIRFAKRDINRHDNPGEFIAFACLIPVLVVLSGVFAGLTLGYMSLDETQLNVLSLSGTPKQREYANRIKPIRKNGHLLLVTLLLANMIVNETLPIISDPVFGGGLPAVIVSTVLIVIFSEIIPQSVCTRYGLYIGAKMAIPVRILIYVFGIFSWPIAKLLEFVLGPHHGIIYRRAELKELIAMHGSQNPLGGDLRHDTVTIIGATLDLQDKTVRHAMTPINKVFMLHIDSKLDYDTLRRICSTGHSRIPVYEEVEVSIPGKVAIAVYEAGFSAGFAPGSPEFNREDLINSDEIVKVRVKKIRGILLVKQCVLLDPEDAIPVRKMRLNKVPIVPQNEPLLGILDRFQEGRSHMAIISRISIESAQSVKKAVKKGLTQRLLGAVRGDSSASETSDESGDEEDEGMTAVGSEKNKDKSTISSRDAGVEDEGEAPDDEKEEKRHRYFRGRGRKSKRGKHSDQKEDEDLEQGDADEEKKRDQEKVVVKRVALEQTMPADAVLSKESAAEYLASQAFSLEPELMPLGIITLEDVLEELIGEEIYDEFDVEGTGAHSQSFVPPGADQDLHRPIVKKNSAPELVGGTNKDRVGSGNIPGSITPPVRSNVPRTLGLVSKPIAIPGLKSILRSRSAPPTPRQPAKTFPGQGVSPANTSQGDSNAPTVNVTEASTESGSAVPNATEGDARALAQIVESPSPAGSGDEKQLGALAIAAAQVTASTSLPSANFAAPKATLAAPTFPLLNAAAVTPRSGSPAPSLEAILVERKRRGQMSGTSSASSPGPSGSAAAPIDRPGGLSKLKGGFKSSPLSPVAAGADVIVADEIRKQKQMAKQNMKEGDAQAESAERTNDDDFKK